MSKKSNNFWANVEAKLEAGKHVDLFVNHAGRICLNNGVNGAELPARLLAKVPSSLIEAATAKAAERVAGEAAKAEERRAARLAHEAKIESLRHRRCWVLGGLYMEEQTVQKYTLQELVDWRDWARYFRYKNPSVTITALADDGSVIVADDWSEWFRDFCGERCPATENMAKMAADLARYTNERRSFHALSN